ncbi:helix-turn-helix domain-containing protein [Scopulibacillus cellulosilyticus]|uniref:Helix-turn-helix domain-containing protein n=1 Tax=Scopulibacillus cellulosilyticus TaxID=2665665 RepID=A0ABW2PT53_9BACL
MVNQGTFRKDLYFRLNVLTLELPLLRKRLSDIPELVRSFLIELNEMNKKKIFGISDEVLSLFYRYDWPGNVRELRNVVERMVLLTDEKTIMMKDAGFFKNKMQKQLFDNLNLQKSEKAAITLALEETNGNKTKAAEKLGFNRSTLWRKMKRYGI